MGVAAESSSLIEVTPEQLERRLAEGTTVLIDVREAFEHAGESIRGSRLVPLDTLDREALRREFAGRRVVFHCRTGKRSAKAAERFAGPGEAAEHLAGGIEAWKASGREVERAARAPKLDVMRQVQITAGSLVLLGVVLGTSVSPWFLVVSGFVGAGLVFAGASGWCGMAKLLAAMPWNRVAAP